MEAAGSTIDRSVVGAMVAAVVPGVAYAEAFSDSPDLPEFAAERAVVAEACAARRREFATARRCARTALTDLGLPLRPILPDADGVPRWPIGVTGSMTHCAGYRAAAVVRTDGVIGVGIDSEPHAALPGPVRDLVLRADDWRNGDIVANGRCWDRAVFCAKEAVYKAWFPLTRLWLDFTDVSVSLCPDGSFHAQVWVRAPMTVPRRFAGRWMITDDRIATATAVLRTRPAVGGRALAAAAGQVPAS